MNRYLEGGNAELAVYRDDPQPTAVAREFRSMVDQMPELTAFMPGFSFVTINRSRSDGLSGFTGLFVRRRVRREVRDGALTVLRTTQRKLETPRTP